LGSYLDRVAASGARGWREPEGLRGRRLPGIFPTSPPAPPRRIIGAAATPDAPDEAASPAAEQLGAASPPVGEQPDHGTGSVTVSPGAPSGPLRRKAGPPRRAATRASASRPSADRPPQRTAAGEAATGPAAGAKGAEAKPAVPGGDAERQGPLPDARAQFDAAREPPPAMRPSSRRRVIRPPGDDATVAGPGPSAAPSYREPSVGGDLVAGGSAVPAERPRDDGRTPDMRTASAQADASSDASQPVDGAAPHLASGARAAQADVSSAAGQPVVAPVVSPAPAVQSAQAGVPFAAALSAIAAPTAPVSPGHPGQLGGARREPRQAERATIVIGRMEVQVVHQAPPVRRRRAPAAVPAKETPDVHHLGRFRLIP
jgi:hypothetical protein